MRPLVILNTLDTSKILDLKVSVPCTLINSDAEKLAKEYKTMDIKETFDGEKPCVVISCSFPKGVNDSDKNFTPIW